MVQMLKNTFRLGLLVAFMLLIVACGWRLRGSVDLPEQMKKVNLIQLVENRDVNSRLIKALKSGGAEVVESKVGADVSIMITKIQLNKKSAAVDSQGRIIAQEVILNLSYNLQDKVGNMLIEQDTIRLSRIYRYDPDNVLGMEREESRVLSGLIDEVVVALINRIKYSFKSQKQQGQPSAN